jgi:uncharacterized protein YraI
MVPRMRPVSVTISALLLAAATTFAPVAIAAAPVSAAPVIASHHKCTRTTTHKCIRGGEFCPQAKYGKSGWSATGKRYVCKGDHTHPHWELP